MEGLINLKYVVGSIVYSLLGILILCMGFLVIDRITSHGLWRSITKDSNVAMAIVIAGFTIGVSMIIASAIHG